MSRTSTGRVRRILPTTRGTGVFWPRLLTISAGMLVVDALQRRGEMVGVALAPHLAVGDDVDAGALHVADGEQGGVVLRLLQERLGHAPDLVQPRARHDLAQHLAVHQPVGLRIGADDGGLQQGVGHVIYCTLMPASLTSSAFSLSSRAIILSNSAGVVGAGSAPSAASRSLTSGEASACHDLLVEPLDDRGRRAGRRQHADPEIVGAALEARLLGGRHVGQHRGALGAADGQRHHAACRGPSAGPRSPARRR